MSFLVTAPFASVSAGAFALAPLAANPIVTKNTDVAVSSLPESDKNSQNMKLLGAALTSDLTPSQGGGDISIVDGEALEETGGASNGTIVSGDKPDKRTGYVSIYVVRQGDTISEIADLFGVSTNTIRWANSIKSGEPIHEGQTLIILPITGVEHTVKKGDTLKSIAAEYHADYQEVLNYNDVSANTPLKIGSTIIIPDGEVAAPKSSASQTTSKSSSHAVSSGASNKSVGYFIEPLKHFVKTQGIHGHNAVDLAAPVGTPIYAAASGNVIVSRNNGGWNGGYGNYVVVNHPNGEQTLYAHMSSDIVAVGQHVVQGQVIGYIGVTGETTGPHLHVEVHGGTNPF